MKLLKISVALTISLSTTTIGYTNYSVKYINSKQLKCLKNNIYHEARGEPYEGMIAVAVITINRAGHDYSNLCRTIFKKGQFSWTANKQYTLKLYDTDIVSKAAYTALTMPVYPKIYFYHNKTVNPYWAKTRTYTETIGNHFFYE